jgi:hypothetical protein
VAKHILNTPSLGQDVLEESLTTLWQEQKEKKWFLDTI